MRQYCTERLLTVNYISTTEQGLLGLSNIIDRLQYRSVIASKWNKRIKIDRLFDDEFNDRRRLLKCRPVTLKSSIIETLVFECNIVQLYMQIIIVDRTFSHV